MSDLTRLSAAELAAIITAAREVRSPASGVFGSQPTSLEYGAHRFSVAPGIDPVTGRTLAGAVTHNDYFSVGGSSLRNLALIGLGEGDSVTDANRSAGDALKALGTVGRPGV